MIDIKLLREDLDGLIRKLEVRGKDFSFLKKVYEEDIQLRESVQKIDALKNEKNLISKEIGSYKKEKKDASMLIEKVEKIKEKIKDIETSNNIKSKKIKEVLELVPNIPNEKVPLGKSEEENLLIKKWGEIIEKDFNPKPHYEIV